ncbi:MAG: transketolase C-terminal domain-containing protein [Clostridia bacterium]|nr:transketolase C-terminal domain-containing protein [Clostridia bacterium]
MKIIQKSIETLRVLSAEIISAGKIGDTGTALSASTLLYTLFKDHYNFYGGDSYINRDRFVMAAGSASAVYYSLMNMFGFDISGSDLKNYAQFKTKTPYSPELDLTEGVDCTAGPLGQGVATSVGLAISQAFLAKKFNAQKFNIISSHTYCFVNEANLMSGESMEALSLAGTLNLNNLILLYNNTGATNDGSLENINNEKVKRKFKAMGWKVITVYKGDNYLWDFIAIKRAKRSQKPTLIIFKTKAGQDSVLEGTYESHNKILQHKEIEKIKADYNFNGAFNISNEVKQYCMRTHRRLKVKYLQWERQVVLYKNTHPELAEQLNAFYDKPKISLNKILKSTMQETENMREFNNVILNQLSTIRPCIMGGSADNLYLTKARLNEKAFSKTNYRGRHIHFGSRNQAIGAVCNGISLYFGAPSYCSSTLLQSSNMLPSMRLSVQMNLPVLYIFTHDSVFSGNFGQSFLPVEQLAQLRAIPNFYVFRPKNNEELLACYSVIYKNESPSALVLSGENCYKETNDVKSKNIVTKETEQTEYDQAINGAYILSEDDKAEIIIFASGSEVDLAIEAKQILNKSRKKVCVVSVPSIELFEKQTDKYKNSVLKKDIKTRVAVEASNDKVWYKYIGFDGLLFNINTFGISGNSEEAKNHFKFNAKKLVSQIKAIKA